MSQRRTEHNTGLIGFRIEAFSSSVPGEISHPLISLLQEGAKREKGRMTVAAKRAITTQLISIACKHLVTGMVHMGKVAG